MQEIYETGEMPFLLFGVLRYFNKIEQDITIAKDR